MNTYFVHESSYIDGQVEIGDRTKIWHFCHIQSGAVIGADCSLGQNVNISSHVKIGNHVKIQNNVSVYEGVELEDYVFCGPSMVFTNDLTPRSQYPKGSAGYKKTLVKRVCHDCSRSCCHKKCRTICVDGECSGKAGRLGLRMWREIAG